ncbi:MAG: hypothetical protein HRU02_18900 [Myxococcales bacterium]|nr:hypothetical protein [Myxococcales bacterium]
MTEHLPEATARWVDVFLAVGKAWHPAIEAYQFVVALNERGEMVEAFASPSTPGTRTQAQKPARFSYPPSFLL